MDSFKDAAIKGTIYDSSLKLHDPHRLLSISRLQYNVHFLVDFFIAYFSKILHALSLHEMAICKTDTVGAGAFI